MQVAGGCSRPLPAGNDPAHRPRRLLPGNFDFTPAPGRDLPARVSRRVNDVVLHDRPQWRLEPPPSIAGRRVLIVDEIVDSGETITMVKEKAAA